MNLRITIGAFSSTAGLDQFDIQFYFEQVHISLEYFHWLAPESKMSSINLATLKYMNRDALAAILQAGTTPAKLAIIDVRDSGIAKSDLKC